MRALGGSIGLGHPLRPHMDVIESKVPAELLDRVRRHPPPDSPHADVPSEKALVRLHKQVRRLYLFIYLLLLLFVIILYVRFQIVSQVVLLCILHILYIIQLS